MKIVRDWLLMILLFSNLFASESNGIAMFGGFESKPEKGRMSFINPGYELNQILKDVPKTYIDRQCTLVIII